MQVSRQRDPGWAKRKMMVRGKMNFGLWSSRGAMHLLKPKLQLLFEAALVRICHFRVSIKFLMPAVTELRETRYIHPV